MDETDAARLLVEQAMDGLVAASSKDPLALATLAARAMDAKDRSRAVALAGRAMALAPTDLRVIALARQVLSDGVPNWHFRMVNDRLRNAAYEAALIRAIRPDSKVLDIGSGTGLLAMMAARAGSRHVTTCEVDAGIAQAAAEIVALNGLGDRIAVLAKRSDAVTLDDIGGRADIIVSELLSDTLLGECVLPVMADVVPRLLAPGGQMIPARGQVRVALAYFDGVRPLALDRVEGFDMAPFNRLAPTSQSIVVDHPKLALRSAPVDLFDVDFASGGPFKGGRATLPLHALGGPVNGIVQWIGLHLDSATFYENRPGAGTGSHWSANFHPFTSEIAPEPGTLVSVRGDHHVTSLRIWTDL